MKPLNLLFVFGDQWRAQATGYAGDPNVRTPHLDRLAAKSVNFTTAVANCPVCSPYRATLLTGQYPLTHGIFLNDAHLGHDAPSVADVFRDAGYDTAYIGKWHLDGRGRKHFIPRDSRQGFDYWKVLECTHDYNHSQYYADDDTPLFWDGYDAEAQTRDAQDYLRTRRDADKPFLLFLSWGPPHNPCDTAPQRFRDLYDPSRVELRPNVPDDAADAARKDLAGYYAHCSAMDEYVGDLLGTLDESGLAENTLFVFTSDHGDMLGSQGQQRKQRPWDESIRVPCLLRCPALFEDRPREVAAPFNSPDVMPTLLGLCGLPIPGTVEGADWSGHLLRDEPAPADAALIACYHPFGEYTKQGGGKEYRGVRTERWTYVRDLDGPWLLYDNAADPYQQDNLCGREGHAAEQARLDTILNRLLAEQGDEFLPGTAYVAKWNYPVNENGTLSTRP